MSNVYCFLGKLLFFFLLLFFFFFVIVVIVVVTASASLKCHCMLIYYAPNNFE